MAEEVKRTLTTEELVKLEEQYWSLTQTLHQYEAGMKSEGFKLFTPEKRDETKKQFKFMKFALNETVMVLIMFKFLKDDMAKDASGNRFITLNTKFRIMEYNRVKSRKYSN